MYESGGGKTSTDNVSKDAKYVIQASDSVFVSISNVTRPHKFPILL